MVAACRSTRRSTDAVLACICSNVRQFVLHTSFILGGGGGIIPWQAGRARSPEGTQEISQNHGSELSNATIVPGGDVVADMIRGEDELNLMQEMQWELPRP